MLKTVLPLLFMGSVLASGETIARISEFGPGVLQFTVSTQISKVGINAPLTFVETQTAQKVLTLNGPMSTVPDFRVIFGDMGNLRREFVQEGLPNATVVTTLRFEIPEIGYELTDRSVFGFSPDPLPVQMPKVVPTGTTLTLKLTNTTFVNTGTPAFANASLRGGLLGTVRLSTPNVTLAEAVPEPGTGFVVLAGLSGLRWLLR